MEPQEFINNHPQWSVVIFILYFVSLWCVVAAAISVVGGWHQLSKKFRQVHPFDGVSDGLQSGQMRWFANYRGCLRLGANEEGLYMGVLSIFRFMHPPLLVPWNQIRAFRAKRWLFGEYVTFTLGSELRIPLRISGTTAAMLRDGAGTHWPKELQ
jgi:hypothetical protein